MNANMVKRYRIGEVSKITNLPVSRLRYYDKIGLLCPRWRDETSEYRLYDAYQIKEAYQIEQFQYFGFSLTQISTIMNKPLSFFENVDKISTTRLTEIEEEIAYLNKIKGKLEKMQHYNHNLFTELQTSQVDGYELGSLHVHSYIMSDLRLDLSYSSHLTAAITAEVEMYEQDRKLPWYYSDHYYQLPLKNMDISSVGKFCIRLCTDEEFDTPLSIYREEAPYRIKYMGLLSPEEIPGHLRRMLDIAEEAGYHPASNYYYVGELAMDSTDEKESALRQIYLPLVKSEGAVAGHQ